MIKEFKKRFGKVIPSKHLELFQEDKDLARIMAHDVGRELIYSPLKIVSSSIKHLLEMNLSDLEKL